MNKVKYMLFPHQKALFTTNEKIIYLRCGRGAGKTFCAALLCAIRLLQGQRIICLSPTNRNSEEVMLPAIMGRLDQIIPDGYTYKPQAKKIIYKKGVIYFASYESMENLRGFTSISLAVCDEAAMAPPDLFSVLSFTMRDLPENVEGKIVLLSTPRPENWLTTFIKENNVKIISAKTSDNKRIKQSEIDLMKKTCLDENAWRREFYGEECEDNTEGILFSNALLTSCSKVPPQAGIGYAIGVDCSGLGVDNNVIVVRGLNKILKVEKIRIATAAEMCSRIKAIIEEYGKNNLSHIAIDEAYGLDLANRLKEASFTPRLVPFGGKPMNEVYANLRAEMYCNMKKQIEEFGMIGLTEEMKRELTCTKYILSNSNKIQIIPKGDIKLVLGRSPDSADALALTYVQPLIPRESLELQLMRDCEDMSDF